MIFGSRRRRSGGNSNFLTFWTTCDNTSTFDPKITGVDGIWRFDDGSVLVGTSGVEIFKTFASGGLHWAKFYPGVGGLAAITRIDANTDLLTSIWGIEKIPVLVYLSLSVNADLVMSLASVPQSTTLYARDCNHLFGSVAQLKNGCQTVHIYRSPSILPGSISHLTTIGYLRLDDLGWLAADVDTVLLSASNAIWANLGHFTHVAPSLLIGGTNAAPSGTIGAATTSPLVTPGAGNSDADWLWVAGVSEHYPVSGCAAVYYMRNNVGHAWAVTITGEA